MFGLQNHRGSCWVNTCIQAILRIPDIQTRYESNEFDSKNIIDESLYKIWKSKGTDGLTQLFAAVRTDVMPAGNGIGDSHELLQYLCDKLPFLDTLVRFKIADSITCINCNTREIKEDSVVEFSLSSDVKNRPMTECIADSVKENFINEWKCEKCSNVGCRKQQLIGSFPKVMIFHMIPTNGSVDYPSILSLNGKQYALISVSCYNNAHWWGYGRNMPPGSSWFTLDDLRLHEHGPKQFPVSNRMRLLIYYRLEN